jgi:uncharacterized protein YgiB involved in biofilm formation
MRKRATLQISLVLIGCAVLAGCGSEQQRKVYRNKQDCLDDWGGNEKDCEPAPRSSSHFGYFYGPFYRGTLAGGRGMRSIGSVSVTRGGFGSLGSFHASGG